MESALYSIYALVFESEISLVRFLIRQQLVRQCRAPALSMKYSLYIHIHMNNDFIIHVHDRNYLFFSRLYALHNSVSKLRAKSFFG